MPYANLSELWDMYDEMPNMLPAIKKDIAIIVVHKMDFENIWL